ncbi:hypothetical protein LCGC14_1463530 [marine sediment metagenome]|uniref:Uncharacterized protein n=1 Tax=marine sediment metagenome TaxID=412755 RepID=A0A0F9JEF2_9ZZZZ
MVHEYQPTKEEEPKLDIRNTFHPTKEQALTVATALEKHGYKIWLGVNGSRYYWSRKYDCYMVQYYREGDFK